MIGALVSPDDNATQILPTQVYEDYLRSNFEVRVSPAPQDQTIDYDLENKPSFGRTNNHATIESSPPLSLPAPGPPKTPVFAGRKRNRQGHFTDSSTPASKTAESLSAFKKDHAISLTQLFETTQAEGLSSPPLDPCPSDEVFNRPSPCQDSPPLHCRLTSSSQPRELTDSPRKPGSEHEQTSNMTMVADNALFEEAKTSLWNVDSTALVNGTGFVGGQAKIQSAAALSQPRNPVSKHHSARCRGLSGSPDGQIPDHRSLKTPGRTHDQAIIVSSDGRHHAAKPQESVSDDEGILPTPRASAAIFHHHNSDGAGHDFSIYKHRSEQLQKGTDICEPFAVSIADSQRLLSQQPSSPRPRLSSPMMSGVSTVYVNRDSALEKAGDSSLRDRQDASGLRAIPETPAAPSEDRHSQSKSERRNTSPSRTGLRWRKADSTVANIRPRSQSSKCESPDLMPSTEDASKENLNPNVRSGLTEDVSTTNLRTSGHSQMTMLDTQRPQSASRRPSPRPHLPSANKFGASRTEGGRIACADRRQSYTHGAAVAPKNISSLPPEHPKRSLYTVTSSSKSSGITNSLIARAPHRVWACFKSSVRGSNYFPASCIRETQSNCGGFLVRFDDGTEQRVEAHLLRSLDLRLGDVVKVDEDGRRNAVFMISSFVVERQSTQNTLTSSDVQGNHAVMLSLKSGRRSLNSSLLAHETIRVRISSLYLTPTLWPTYEDRSLRHRRVDFRCLEGTDEANTKRIRKTADGLDLKAPQPPHESHSDALFQGVAFALSFSSRSYEERRKTVTRMVQLNSGLVLDEGFEELFYQGSAAGTQARGEECQEDLLIPCAYDQLLDIQPRHASIHFAVLLADTYLRTGKYLQALALNIPCLSTRWVSDCVQRGTLLPWTRYLLPAGESMLLDNAVRSRTMHGPLANGAFSQRLSEMIAFRPSFLRGLRFAILLGHRKAADEQRVMQFVLVALGASQVLCASDAEAVDRLAEHHGGFDYVCVGHTGVPELLKSHYKVIDRHEIVQSLIVGEFLCK